MLSMENIIFTEIPQVQLLQYLIDDYVIIASDNGLAPTRCQTIIGSNEDQSLFLLKASPENNELNLPNPCIIIYSES